LAGGQAEAGSPQNGYSQQETGHGLGCHVRERNGLWQRR
jgi:hypothetical protein